jgi:NADH-quinone oxidoreductase subunit L
VAAAILLLAGRRTDAWGHLLGCTTPIASFVVGAVMFADMLGRDAELRAVHETLFSWVPVARLQVDFGLTLDQLSMCFVLLITGVGSLIHVYSVGYMADDPDRRRFFGYLNLFLAAMLLLVLADNYLGLYVGWEGVGLASYLLIGFWYHKPSGQESVRGEPRRRHGPCDCNVRHVRHIRHHLLRRGVLRVAVGQSRRAHRDWPVAVARCVR